MILKKHQTLNLDHQPLQKDQYHDLDLVLHFLKTPKNPHFDIDTITTLTQDQRLPT